MSSTFIRLGQGGSVSFKDGVATAGDLPISGNNIEDVRAVLTPPSLYMWDGSSWIDITTGGGGGSGTVTSVNMTVPSFLNVSGNPITTSGTLAVTLTSEAQNSIFAGPTSGSGVPTFRTLTSADIANAFPLLAPNGTLSAPSYSFSGETNTGMYRPSGASLGFSVLGGQVLQLNTSSIQGDVHFIAPAGNSSIPSYSFSAETNTGMYLSSAGNIGVTVTSSKIINISASGTVLNSGLSVQSKTVSTNYNIL